MNKPGNMSL